MLTLNRLLEYSHYQVSENKVYTPCQPGDIGAIKVNIMEIPAGCVSYTPVTTLEDALNCVHMATPSTSSNIRLIEKFHKERCESCTTPTVTNDKPSRANIFDGLANTFG